MGADLPTPAEYKQLRRQFLDNEFAQRYPVGMFTIRRGQAWFGPPTELRNVIEIEWKPTRESIHTIKSMKINDGPIRSYTVLTSPSTNRTYYANLDDLLAGAERLNIPEDIVTAFVNRYNNRLNEGFNI